MQSKDSCITLLFLTYFLFISENKNMFIEENTYSIHCKNWIFKKKKNYQLVQIFLYIMPLTQLAGTEKIKYAIQSLLLWFQG